MVIKNAMFKLAMFAAAIISIFLISLSYLFFEKLISEKEIVITIINKEKFGTEEGKYLIFTPDEVFENFNRFYHRKTNADEVYDKLERGLKYRVKVVGVYLPGIPRLRNITEVIRTELRSEKDY
jgi:hypothetical protein